MDHDPHKRPLYRSLGLAPTLGIDRFMSAARALTHLVDRTVQHGPAMAR